MFKPINEAHAIAEAVVFFEFNPDLSQVLPMPGLKAKLATYFPLVEELPEVRIDFRDGRLSVAPLSSTAKLSRLRANGLPEWQINVSSPTLSFHCLDYTRWAIVWPEMRKYMGIVFHELGAAPTSIASVGLKFIDRFVWTDAPAKYDASYLFRRESLRLHPAAFSSGGRWHCHTGWFEDGSDLGEILNQLNIDSGNAIVEGTTTVLVALDHTQTLRRQAANALDKYSALSGSESGPLDNLMKQLHIGNKGVLRDLLNARMAKLIKLDGDVQ